MKKKEESVRTKFAILLAVAVVCVTAAWGWTPEVPITNNRLENVTYSGGHSVVYGNDGIGHVVWYDNGGGIGQSAVYYKRYYPNTGWTSELKLNNNGAWPAIALDADGKTVHVVWWGYKHVGTVNFHILYQKCVPGKSGTGGWVGKPTDLCVNTPGHSVAYPSVACGPNGQVVATWMEQWGTGADLVRTYEFREYASGQWHAQQEIQDPIPSHRWTPSISTDKSGNVFVAYYGSMSLESRDSFHVYVNSRLSGVWQEWENVTMSASYPDSFISPDIDVDPETGNPHVVCHSYSIDVSGTDTTRYYHIYHTYRSGSGWTIPAMISDPDDRADVGPSMYLDAGGTAHVIWGQKYPDNGIEYRARNPITGAWSALSWVALNNACAYTSPSITVGLDGTLYGVWTRIDSTAKFPYQIWGSSSSGSFGPMAGTTVTTREFALDVSPNPASRRMVVDYLLPVAGNVSLKLYDVSGAFVKTVACGHTLPGSHAVSLSREGLARGAYILKLQSGASSVTRKLVIE